MFNETVHLKEPFFVCRRFGATPAMFYKYGALLITVIYL